MKSPDAESATANDEFRWIGKNLTKPDALEKALGATEYVGDMLLPGMLHGKILWAGTAHAVIRNIDTTEASRVPGSLTSMFSSSIRQWLERVSSPAMPAAGEPRTKSRYSGIRDQFI